MASDGESSCVSDPNFAVICSFFERFGAQCGLKCPDFLELQEMLENTEEMAPDLVDIHLKLLRKIKKSVSTERWEKILIKVCHTFSSQDAWEVERFGYKKARTSSKVRILKNLCDMQFDHNSKFKGEINKLTSKELRSEPLGRDKLGNCYWYMIDEQCQLRVYREDPDEETWTVVAKDRVEMINLIKELSSGECKDLETNLNEDSNSNSVEKPVTDTGQQNSTSVSAAPSEPDESTNASTDSNKNTVLQSNPENKDESISLEKDESTKDESSKEDNSKDESVKSDSLKDESIKDVKDEGLTESNSKDIVVEKKPIPVEEKQPEIQKLRLTVKNFGKINEEVKNPDSVVDLACKKRKSINELAANLHKNQDSQESNLEKLLKQRGITLKPIKKPEPEPLSDDEDEEFEEINLPSHMKQPRLDRPKLLDNRPIKPPSEEEDDDDDDDDDEEFDEEIEEPVMYVRGEGSGADCNSENVFSNDEDLSEVIEEEIMFVYGEGSGRECETGNEKKAEEEKNVSNSEKGSTSSIPGCLEKQDENLLSPTNKIGTVVFDSGNKVLKNEKSPKKHSRWDVKSETSIDESVDSALSYESEKIDDDTKPEQIPMSVGKVKSLISRWEEISSPSAKNDTDETDSTSSNPRKMFFFGPQSMNFGTCSSFFISKDNKEVPTVTNKADILVENTNTENEFTVGNESAQNATQNESETRKLLNVETNEITSKNDATTDAISKEPETSDNVDLSSTIDSKVELSSTDLLLLDIEKLCADDSGEGIKDLCSKDPDASRSSDKIIEELEECTKDDKNTEPISIEVPEKLEKTNNGNKESDAKPGNASDVLSTNIYLTPEDSRDNITENTNENVEETNTFQKQQITSLKDDTQIENRDENVEKLEKTKISVGVTNTAESVDICKEKIISIDKLTPILENTQSEQNKTFLKDDTQIEITEDSSITTDVSVKMKKNEEIEAVPLETFEEKMDISTDELSERKEIETLPVVDTPEEKTNISIEKSFEKNDETSVETQLVEIANESKINDDIVETPAVQTEKTEISIYETEKNEQNSDMVDEKKPETSVETELMETTNEIDETPVVETQKTDVSTDESEKKEEIVEKVNEIDVSMEETSEENKETTIEKQLEESLNISDDETSEQKDEIDISVQETQEKSEVSFEKPFEDSTDISLEKTSRLKETSEKKDEIVEETSGNKEENDKKSSVISVQETIANAEENTDVSTKNKISTVETVENSEETTEISTETLEKKKVASKTPESLEESGNANVTMEKNEETKIKNDFTEIPDLKTSESNEKDVLIDDSEKTEINKDASVVKSTEKNETASVEETGVLTRDRSERKEEINVSINKKIEKKGVEHVEENRNSESVVSTTEEKDKPSVDENISKIDEIMVGITETLKETEQMEILEPAETDEEPMRVEETSKDVPNEKDELTDMKIEELSKEEEEITTVTVEEPTESENKPEEEKEKSTETVMESKNIEPTEIITEEILNEKEETDLDTADVTLEKAVEVINDSERNEKDQETIPNQVELSESNKDKEDDYEAIESPEDVSMLEETLPVENQKRPEISELITKEENVQIKEQKLPIDIPKDDPSLNICLESKIGTVVVENVSRFSKIEDISIDKLKEFDVVEKGGVKIDEVASIKEIEEEKQSEVSKIEQNVEEEISVKNETIIEKLVENKTTITIVKENIENKKQEVKNVDVKIEESSSVVNETVEIVKESKTKDLIEERSEKLTEIPIGISEKSIEIPINDKNKENRIQENKEVPSIETVDEPIENEKIEELVLEKEDELIEEDKREKIKEPVDAKVVDVQKDKRVKNFEKIEESVKEGKISEDIEIKNKKNDEKIEKSIEDDEEELHIQEENDGILTTDKNKKLADVPPEKNEEGPVPTSEKRQETLEIQNEDSNISADKLEDKSNDGSSTTHVSPSMSDGPSIILCDDNTSNEAGSLPNDGELNNETLLQEIEATIIENKENVMPVETESAAETIHETINTEPTKTYTPLRDGEGKSESVDVVKEKETVISSKNEEKDVIPISVKEIDNEQNVEGDESKTTEEITIIPSDDQKEVKKSDEEKLTRKASQKESVPSEMILVQDKPKTNVETTKTINLEQGDAVKRQKQTKDVLDESGSTSSSKASFYPVETDLSLDKSNVEAVKSTNKKPPVVIVDSVTGVVKETKKIDSLEKKRVAEATNKIDSVEKKSKLEETTKSKEVKEVKEVEKLNKEHINKLVNVADKTINKEKDKLNKIEMNDKKTVKENDVKSISEKLENNIEHAATVMSVKVPKETEIVSNKTKENKKETIVGEKIEKDVDDKSVENDLVSIKAKVGNTIQGKKEVETAKIEESKTETKDKIQTPVVKDDNKKDKETIPEVKSKEKTEANDNKDSKEKSVMKTKKSELIKTEEDIKPKEEKTKVIQRTTRSGLRARPMLPGYERPGPKCSKKKKMVKEQEAEQVKKEPETVKKEEKPDIKPETIETKPKAKEIVKEEVTKVEEKTQTRVTRSRTRHSLPEPLVAKPKLATKKNIKKTKPEETIPKEEKKPEPKEESKPAPADTIELSSSDDDGGCLGFADDDIGPAITDSEDEPDDKEPETRPMLSVIDIKKLQEKSNDKPEKKKTKAPVESTIVINDDSDNNASDPLAIETPTKSLKNTSITSLSFDTEEVDTANIFEPIRRSLRRRQVEVSPVVNVSQKRPREQDDDNTNVAKKAKMHNKRVINANLRKSIEEQKNKENSSSDEEKEKKEESAEKPKQVIKGKRAQKLRGFALQAFTAARRKEGKTDLDQSQDSPIAVSSDPDTSRTSATPTPTPTPTSKPRKKRCMGLELDPSAIIQENKDDSGRTLRHSRRIAQIKIKEEAERVKLEQFTVMEQIHKSKKKSKKDEDKDYKTEKKKKGKQSDTTDEEVEQESEEEEDTSSKKKHKKKRKPDDLKKLFNISNAWKSSSDSSSEDEEEEEEVEEYEEEDIRKEVFKSDHEFSPESDIEEASEIQPTRRARTVKKESDTEEPTDDQACQKCGKSDHPEFILLCDSCDNGWHCSCLRPALFVIPEGDWFCPPCQHLSLVTALKAQLVEYDKAVNKMEMEQRRKERLAYVGISLANVLPAKNREQGEHGDKRQDDTESEDSESVSTGSSSGSEDSEPIYQLRERRQAHSYRFNDYDDLINSAIREEVEVKGAGNQGRGKDISTIVNAEKEEQAAQAMLEARQEGEQEPRQETQPLRPETEELPEELPPVVPVDKEIYEQKEVYSDDDPPVGKKLKGRKKQRKLNCLDDESEGDNQDSDEDFKGDSDSAEEELEDELGSGYSDDSYGGRRRGSGAIRRSTRARTTRYDNEFINDDSDDVPVRKKYRSIWDESASEDSDKSWGRRDKRKRSHKPREIIYSSKKRKKSKKKRRRNPDSDGEPRPKVKRPRIQYGGLNDSEEEEELLPRRTRGKKMTYVDTLGSDSEEEKPKKTARISESEDEYVANDEEDEEEVEAEVDMERERAVIEDHEETGGDGDKPPVVPKKIIKLPKLIPKSPRARGRGRGIGVLQRQIISNISISPIKPPPPVLDPDIPGENDDDDYEEEEEEEEQQNDVPKDIPRLDIPVIAANPEGLDDEEVGMMMEEEEFANKQLELMAIQLAKEKKRKEMEAQQKTETLQPAPVPIVNPEAPGEPKKRGRRKKFVEGASPLKQQLQQNLTVPPMIISKALLNPPLPMFNKEVVDPERSLETGEVPTTVQDISDSPPKRRGRGKGKKTLAAEQAAAAAAAAAGGRPPSDSSNISGDSQSENSLDPNFHGGKLGIATPPQPFTQSQPAPSVITRMLQSQPVSAQQPFAAAANAMSQKYFGGIDQSRGGNPFPGIVGRVPSPYRQNVHNNYPPNVRPMAPGSPHRLRSPGPGNMQPMFHSSHHLDPSPSGGGITNRDAQSPGDINKGTPPPNQYGRGIGAPPGPSPGPPIIPSPNQAHVPPPGQPHVAPPGAPHVPPPGPSGPPVRPPHHMPFPQQIPPESPPRPPAPATGAGNFSPYHPPPPPNYHYGAYPPPPSLTAADDALPPTQYQTSPYPEPYNNPPEGVGVSQPSEGSNSKPFDEEGSGEFGGLVSYFSSQREDDLDA